MQHSKWLSLTLLCPSPPPHFDTLSLVCIVFQIKFLQSKPSPTTARNNLVSGCISCASNHHHAQTPLPWLSQPHVQRQPQNQPDSPPFSILTPILVFILYHQPPSFILTNSHPVLKMNKKYVFLSTPSIAFPFFHSMCASPRPCPCWPTNGLFIS